MNREMATEQKVAQSIAPAVYAATKADGLIVDTRGYDAAMVIFNHGAIAGAGDFTPSLEVGDDPALSDGATAPAADLIGSFTATALADTVEKVAYIGPKRYVRAVLTKNGGTSLASGAVIVLGKPAISPVE